MGHKFLFVMGIVVAHGALAAVLASEDGTDVRRPARSTCVRAPAAPLHISPPRELLAYAVVPIVKEEMMHP
jgi:hypothetical protein